MKNVSSKHMRDAPAEAVSFKNRAKTLNPLQCSASGICVFGLFVLPDCSFADRQLLQNRYERAYCSFSLSVISGTERIFTGISGSYLSKLSEIIPRKVAISPVPTPFTPDAMLILMFPLKVVTPLSLKLVDPLET